MKMMKKNWKRSLLLPTLVLPLLAAIGCNSNPVSLYDGANSPLSQSLNPNITTRPKVDMLWVIDNSASMAQEQSSILGNMSLLVDAIEKADLDVNIAITTTSSIENKAGTGSLAEKKTAAPEFKLKAGEFVLKPYANITQDKLKNSNPALGSMTEGTFKAYYDSAWLCADSKPKMEADAAFTELRDKGTKVFPDSYPDILTQDTPFLNTLSQKFRDNSGSFKKSEFLTALKCLSLVGLDGNFVEKGLLAAKESISLNGPNNKEGLKKFLRPNTKLMLVIVSDENDCSSEKPDASPFNDLACSTRACDFFNLPGFSEHFPDYPNPLIPPEQAAEEFIENVRAVKGEDFSRDDIYVFSLTGPNQRMMSKPTEEQKKDKIQVKLNGGGTKEVSNFIFNFDWPSKAQINSNRNGYINALNKIKKGVVENICSKSQAALISPLPVLIPDDQDGVISQIACSSSTYGSATSGDRYLRFLNGFQNRFPSKEDVDSGKTNQSGLLCSGDFRSVFEQMANTLVTDPCIPEERLSGCENLQTGDACGDPAYKGTCQPIPHSNPQKNYCSSYLQVLINVDGPVKVDDTIKTKYCEPDTLDKIDGYKGYCVLKEGQYAFAACGTFRPGIEFNFKNKAEALNDLKGVETQIRYTSIK